MRASINQEPLPMRRKEDASSVQLSAICSPDAVQKILDLNGIPPDLLKVITLFKTVQKDSYSTVSLELIVHHTSTTAGILYGLFFETASNIERRVILNALLTRYPENNETLLLLEALE